MSKLILSAFKDRAEIYISSINPDELMALSDKVFTSKYGNKSNKRIVEEAKLGQEKNYRLILSFNAGTISFQLQSIPIDKNKVKQLGFTIDESIEKYEEIGEMLGKLR